VSWRFCSSSSIARLGAGAGSPRDVLGRVLIVYAGTSRDLIHDPEHIAALMGVAARGMT
jgi:hypothetical protein